MILFSRFVFDYERKCILFTYVLFFVYVGAFCISGRSFSFSSRELGRSSRVQSDSSSCLHDALGAELCPYYPSHQKKSDQSLILQLQSVFLLLLFLLLELKKQKREPYNQCYFSPFHNDHMRIKTICPSWKKRSKVSPLL